MAEAAGLYYELHGPPAGPPLILSSGLGGAAGYWAPNIAALAERHRVIAYDHRGTGRSARDVVGEVTLEAIGADMAALMDAEGVASATIVGHAIGGMAGLALALTSPDRVSRLVIVNGWARLDPHTARCFDTRLALLRGSGARAYLHAQPLFLYPPQWISDHGDRLAEEEAHHLASFPGVDMVERRIAAARGFDAADRLGDVVAPTLLVASDDDMLVPPANSARLAAGIPGARLVRMATGGHACTVTCADDFNTLLVDWLAGGSED